MAEIRSEADERLMQWLRDAHAMEKQAETMLSGMEERIENYPQFRKRLDALGRLGGSASTLKETARICRENLREEEDMAQWLSQNMDQITAEYLDREDRGSDRAKR